MKPNISNIVIQLVIFRVIGIYHLPMRGFIIAKGDGLKARESICNMWSLGNIRDVGGVLWLRLVNSLMLKSNIKFMV